MKHTPGPWLIDGSRDSDEGLSVIHPSGAEIAHITSTLGRAEADIANARLIAAAPDLLKALEAAIPYMEAIDDDKRYIGPVATDLVIVRAAIRKVKGDA